MHHSKHILVVDDDPYLRDFLHAVLTAEGYDVRTAFNGLEAIGYLEQVRPDLVISDVMMPIFDGGILTNIMLAKFGERAAPVLGMTALDTLHRASDRNFKHVLLKPFTIDALLDAIQRVLTDSSHSNPDSSPIHRHQ